MGIFSQYLRASGDGHVIEVEAVDTLLGNEFSLVIDGRRVDQQRALLGGVRLRGVLEDSGTPVMVSITSSLFVTRGPFPLASRYSLTVGGREYAWE